MKLTFACSLALSICIASAAAQTAHPHTTAHHAAVTSDKTACGVELPTLSEKIPALAPSVAACPKELYSLSYVDTVIGTGDPALPRMYYTVNYTGYLADGTKFDSSLDRNEPITFPYGARQVIPGWDTGFEGMHVGGKRRLYIPYQLAYGEAGRPPVIPAKAMLVFDVELISQSDKPPAPKAPTPAPAPPTTPPAGTTPEPQKAAPAPTAEKLPPATTTTPAPATTDANKPK